MNDKFKFGDKVIVGSHTGKIISIRKDGIYKTYRVKFDNRFLIPQEMDYKESELELIESSSAEKTDVQGVKCTCGIEATYGHIPKENHSEYCDLLNKKNVGKKSYDNKNEEEDDLINQFQLMLDAYSDDDDDFGFFD